MGFNNGYDSGYADAIEDVRSGRVAGLGPVSGGTNGGGETTSRAPGVFMPKLVDGGVSGPSGADAVLLDATSTSETVVDQYDETYTAYHVSILAPDGGFVEGDLVMLHIDMDVEGWNHGSSVVLGGQDISSVISDPANYMLIVRFDGASFIRVWDGAVY